MNPPEDIRIKVFPNPPRFLPEDNNPFLYLTYKDMEKRNITVLSNHVRLNLGYIHQNKDKVKILHFHWLSNFGNSNSFLSMVRHMLHYFSILTYARLKGLKLIETIHNFEPHELHKHKYLIKVFNFINHSFLMHRLLVFSDWQCREMNKKCFCDKKTVRLSNPNYADIVDNMPKEKARGIIGLAKEGIVYIFFGYVRPYKGIEDLIAAFHNRRESLFVVGDAFPPAHKNHIADLCRGSKNIKLILGRAPLTELQLYLSASDIAVFPFKKVSNSSSIVFAQSYGKPIIARDLPSIRSITSENSTKYFETSEDLKKLLDKAAGWDLERMGKFSFESVKENTPSEIQRRLAKIYKELVSN